MLTRLDFMACPCCAGHEKVGAAAANHLAAAIDNYLKEYPLVDYIETELLNIRNAVHNATEAGRAKAALWDGANQGLEGPSRQPAESAEGEDYNADPLFD